jgi:hypothetical protein
MLNESDPYSDCYTCDLKCKTCSGPKQSECLTCNDNS